MHTDPLGDAPLSGDLPARESRALALLSVASTALTVAHSLRARGAGRTVLFAALGIGLPVVGEYAGVNITREVRHRTQPRWAGVPLNAVLGWYNIGYAAFAMMESLAAPAGPASGPRRWALPAATAAIATSLDLLLDPYGLSAGLWEWHAGGPYAADIAGANSQSGIPLSNFGGWIILTGTVTLLYVLLAADPAARAPAPGQAGSVRAGRTAALLLLPYYGRALAWAVARRKFRFILYSALAPLAIALALRGRA